MRHRKKFNHLSRTSAHRKAMLSNMATSLILHKRIKTTVAKAKALKIYIEPILTRAKEDSTHSRRMVFKQLQSKEAVSELFREVSLKIADRPGGYTRIIKLGARLGDNAEMCLIELVDYNENLLADTEARKAKTTRRSRRGGVKKTETTVQEEVQADVAVAEEEVEVDEKTPAEDVKEEPKAEAKPEATQTEEKEEKKD